MENLTISDPPPQHGIPPQGPPQQGGGGPMPQMPPPMGRPQQLPAQYFTTAAQLLDLTDKKLMLSLRDGRKMIGILRTWDSYANLVLQSTVERIFVPPGPTNPRGLYADIPVGIFLVRGENVVLLGEIDLDKDDEDPPGYDQADPELVKSLAKQRKADDQKKEKNKVKKLADLGFLGENMGELLL